MISYLRGAALALIILLCAALAVAAQTAAPVCLPSHLVYGQLIREYQEAQVFSGLRADGSLVEVWASQAKGGWTLLVTTPDGVSCVIAVGQSGSAGAPL